MAVIKIWMHSLDHGANYLVHSTNNRDLITWICCRFLPTLFNPELTENGQNEYTHKFNLCAINFKSTWELNFFHFAEQSITDNHCCNRCAWIWLPWRAGIVNSSLTLLVNTHQCNNHRPTFHLHTLLQAQWRGVMRGRRGKGRRVWQIKCFSLHL